MHLRLLTGLFFLFCVAPLDLTGVRGAPRVGASFVELKGQRFQVEVVRTPEAWQRGLMFRQRLGPREGMLFWGTEEREHSFWMKNTYISLDIIFISKDLKVVSIAERTTPLSEESIPSRGRALHILEVVGGTASALGLQAGDSIRLDLQEGSLPKKPSGLGADSVSP